MTTQHTPAPWRIQFNSVSDEYRMLDDDNDQIEFSREQGRANARLISAAPDLLAALEELCLAPNKHRPEEYWEAARAAIAKAKGE
jgi:type VI protein secretion system component VasF